MTLKHFKSLSVVVLGLATISLAKATHFNLVPVDLGSGYALTGTVDTDGTIGSLSTANLTNWNIKVANVSDIVFNKSNTSNYSTGLVSDGVHLNVPTSPDGFTDGGALMFYGGVYNQVRVADFTGAYVAGGESVYIKGSAFDFLPLNQPNGVSYQLGSIDPSISNKFNLTPIAFPNSVTLFGSVTTDGTIGTTHLTDWNVTVRSVTAKVFTPQNSKILSGFGMSTNGQELTVSPLDPQGNSGIFEIGFGTIDITAVFLADFLNDVNGQAGYVSPFDYIFTTPLPLNISGDYVVAKAAQIENLAPITEQIRLGGINNGGTLKSWVSYDGNRRRICKAFVPSISSPIVQVDLDFQSTISAPLMINLSVVGKSVTAGQFKIRILQQNKSTSAFEVVIADTGIGLSTIEYSGNPTGALASYISSSGLLTSRIEIRQTGFSATSVPCMEFDRAHLVVSD